MYSDKENVNILTSLLIAHGIRHAVVCPGSRNAPIVHNLSEAGIECHAVTDERSAGFYALGIALATGEAVAVCVTSGSALLNLAPAIAEAAYRQCPIVAISADRPAERIEQLDGQTIPQQGALGTFAAMSVSLPEPCDAVSRSYCNRLVNEALLAAQRLSRPVHINVPISEPLFSFSQSQLPTERVISQMNLHSAGAKDAAKHVLERIKGAKRPMVVVGQMHKSEELTRSLSIIGERVVAIYEPLSSGEGGVQFDDVLGRIEYPEPYRPDFVLYAGNTLVSKRIKKFLTEAPEAEVWAISPDGQVHDTFCSQTMVIECDVVKALSEIACGIDEIQPSEYYYLWSKALHAAAECANNHVSSFSEMLVVKTFEDMISAFKAEVLRLKSEGVPSIVTPPLGGWGAVHYANSTVVRLGCRYARHFIYVNRGVNGIEGSLSTAAGFSIATDRRTYCVIGDLSFFYDSNALWNQELSGNLRILLINNGGGRIFRTLAGLENSPARDKYVMALHRTEAQGLCQSYGVRYMSANSADRLAEKMKEFIECQSERPVLLEVKMY